MKSPIPSLSPPPITPYPRPILSPDVFAPSRRSPRPGRAAWRDADHDARRELILDAALDLLESHGPEHMTIRRVASRLGVGAMTLYTYVEGQEGLRRELVRRGFEYLSRGCHAACEDLADQRDSLPHPWWPGARHYIRFATERPALFRLMFDTPLPEADHEALRGGFEPLLQRVRAALAEHRGLEGEALDREARRVAGRYWIGIHGLAMLATTGRLAVLEGDLDDLLADLLPGVGPDVNQPTSDA